MESYSGNLYKIFAKTSNKLNRYGLHRLPYKNNRQALETGKITINELAVMCDVKLSAFGNITRRITKNPRAKA